MKYFSDSFLVDITILYFVMTQHDVQKESFLPLGKAKETKAASARKLLEYGQTETGETTDKKLINDFEKTLESLFLLSM